MKLEIPGGDFAAYLFDCDGTLADSMPLHHRAWQLALRPYHCEFEEELFYAWGGRPTQDIVRGLNERLGLHLPPEQIDREREAHYQALIDQVESIPEVVEHVHAQHGRIPLAVVSGSPGHSIRKTLTTLGILDRFEVIVGAEDYAHGKPHPEPFLTAARRLGVDPARCLAFEDADLGVESARAAGMQWVKIAPPWIRRARKA